MAKYIFVTGGVSSSLGKGIIAASLAKLLQARGFRVTIQKFDPYINVDPGTLNPYEHGECFVTEDGAETDLDLGHYERFLNIHTSQANNVTTGKIYKTVIDKEREGAFLGKTVQIIPHITDEIKTRIQQVAQQNEYDIVITEIGGTVGDIESLPYIETIRQLQWEMPEEDCVVIHLALLPYLKAAGELKTKPVQHSVKMLSQDGVRPDVIVCRTETPLSDEHRKKIALFCNVKVEAVIESLDAETIYEVPLFMAQERLDIICLKKMNLPTNQEQNLNKWKAVLQKIKYPSYKINIGLVGKYTQLQDAYKSILESFIHAGAVADTKVKIHFINSEIITAENVAAQFSSLHGVLVAPGFGNRGLEGKITAIEYLRKNKIPFLGICLGMQMACIEFARNVLGLEKASTTELDETTPHPIIHLMEEQKKTTKKGGTMRKGAYACAITPNTRAEKIYGTTTIFERHRHRWEFNNAYEKQFNENGFITSGINPDNKLIEIVELEGHPFFIGVQFHPELKSTVENPHPLFVAFVQAGLNFSNTMIS